MFNSVLNRVLKFSLRNEVCIKIHLMSNYNITYRKCALFYLLDPILLWKDKDITTTVIFRVLCFFLVHSVLTGCVHICITGITPWIVEGYSCDVLSACKHIHVQGVHDMCSHVAATYFANTVLLS